MFNPANGMPTPTYEYVAPQSIVLPPPSYDSVCSGPPPAYETGQFRGIATTVVQQQPSVGGTQPAPPVPLPLPAPLRTGLDALEWDTLGDPVSDASGASGSTRVGATLPEPTRRQIVAKSFAKTTVGFAYGFGISGAVVGAVTCLTNASALTVAVATPAAGVVSGVLLASYCAAKARWK